MLVVVRDVCVCVCAYMVHSFFIVEVLLSLDLAEVEAAESPQDGSGTRYVRTGTKKIHV